MSSGGGVGTDITGKAIQMKNQDVNHFRIRSFMNNMVRGLPLQLIVGMFLRRHLYVSI